MRADADFVPKPLPPGPVPPAFMPLKLLRGDRKEECQLPRGMRDLRRDATSVAEPAAGDIY